MNISNANMKDDELAFQGAIAAKKIVDNYSHGYLVSIIERLGVALIS